MSYQQRNDRREGSRIPVRTARQEWVPRGSTAPAENPPSSFNSNPNGNAGDSNYGSTSAPSGSRHRRGFFRRSYTVRRPYLKSEPEIPGPKEFDVPQLVQEIEDKLAKRAVDCMICYDIVGRSARIWSCSRCYSIFHLSCIKKWARASTSVDFEDNQGVNWRCPGCQSVQLLTAEEIRYVCFCGKRRDPPTDFDLTPHSCGEPCGKPLEREVAGDGDDDEDDRCSHVCVLQCHPGPCPPRKAFASGRRCLCGKETIKTRCSDRKSIPTCGNPCNKLLECGLHLCELICHEGPCDPCPVLIKALCFCKKKVEDFPCGEMIIKGDVRQIIHGAFSCNSICGKKLACGHHFCGENCHPGPCADCKLTWRVNTCYRGKTKIQDERRSCMYPIPTCSQICGIHNHHCNELCHAGNYPPYMVRANHFLYGSSSRTVECYRTMDVRYVCHTACRQKKKVLLQLLLQLVEATGKKLPLGLRKLICAIIIFIVWCLFYIILFYLFFHLKLKFIKG